MCNALSLYFDRSYRLCWPDRDFKLSDNKELSMRYLVIAASLLVGGEAFACPDVSGEFAGKCEEVSSCYGPRPVFYQTSIKQFGCAEVEMTNVGGSEQRSLLKIDENNFTVDPIGGRISTFVAYSSTDLFRTEKIGSSVFNEIIRKVNVGGIDHLEIIFTTRTSGCTVKMECKIPAR